MSSHPRFGTALTDGLFMTSRDGMTFNRWSDTFLQPGIERQHNWVYGDCYQNHGLIETAAEDPTAPPELSLYVIENHSKKLERLRRYTMRIDGFVSARAPQKGGELLTKPLVVAGSSLTLNFSTSVVGSARVELQDANGTPLPGFTIQECNDIFGDSLDRCVGWVSKGELAILAGKPIRLRFALKDADLYSFQFK